VSNASHDAQFVLLRLAAAVVRVMVVVVRVATAAAVAAAVVGAAAVVANKANSHSQKCCSGRATHSSRRPCRVRPSLESKLLAGRAVEK
jgi:hypothetical protein